MKAIVIKQYGDANNLVIQDIPDPVLSSGDVLIKVHAFGINRAEIYMRQGAWGDVAAVNGIECVGRVVEDPSGRLAVDQKVIAVMGGMGRTINGSYAEFTSVPSANVIPIETDLSWQDLAAIPESYATAWSCLYHNMHIDEGHTVFIRGGTSALGQAAINIASCIKEVTVIATTRNEDSVSLLKYVGCNDAFIEQDNLSEQILNKHPKGVDSVLDIVGNTTLLDSLSMTKAHGFVCNAGFLGGAEPIPFNPLMDMPASVNLNFFASFMFGTDGFPLADIPMQEMVDRSAQGVYKNKPAKVFEFADITKAHQLMEANTAGGKIVVTV